MNPHNKDVYSAYNKPEAVIDWLAHNEVGLCPEQARYAEAVSTPDVGRPRRQVCGTAAAAALPPARWQCVLCGRLLSCIVPTNLCAALFIRSSKSLLCPWGKVRESSLS